MKKIFLSLFFAAAFGVAVHSQSSNDSANGNHVVTTTQSKASASHGYVDLELPSGTLWATMNVGATAPEDYGDYFAWGETAPKESYTWATYKWCNGGYNKMVKYCTKTAYGDNGFVDNKEELDPEDDAATVNWGSEWCMPTKDQQDELRNNCTREWTTINGVKGCLLTSNINGASLFLPAAGYRWDTTLYKEGTDGMCWSRNVYNTGPGSARSMYFSSGSIGSSTYSRGYGQSVRAVRAPEGWGPQLMGDANGDGTVNVIDVTSVINFILSENPYPFFKANADVNGDGAVNVQDVTLIVNIILGGE